jgi:hypothetical protein
VDLIQKTPKVPVEVLPVALKEFVTILKPFKDYKIYLLPTPGLHVLPLNALSLAVGASSVVYSVPWSFSKRKPIIVEEKNSKPAIPALFTNPLNAEESDFQITKSTIDSLVPSGSRFYLDEVAFLDLSSLPDSVPPQKSFKPGDLFLIEPEFDDPVYDGSGSEWLLCYYAFYRMGFQNIQVILKKQNDGGEKIPGLPGNLFAFTVEL